MSDIQSADFQDCRVRKRRWRYEDQTIYEETLIKPTNPNDTYSSYHDSTSNSTIYVIEKTIKVIVYEPMKEEDCEDDDKGCYCRYTGEFCKYKSDCPK